MIVKNSNNKIRVKKVQEIAFIASLFRVDWITHYPVKVWIQMNVVPRSTGNTNSGTRELTLKCKL